MLPLFDEQTGATCHPCTGADWLESAVRARAVQPVELPPDDKPGHPLDVGDWRAPVIGDTLWRADGPLVDGGRFACWLVCALSEEVSVRKAAEGELACEFGYPDGWPAAKAPGWNGPHHCPGCAAEVTRA